MEHHEYMSYITAPRWAIVEMHHILPNNKKNVKNHYRND